MNLGLCGKYIEDMQVAMNLDLCGKYIEDMEVVMNLALCGKYIRVHGGCHESGSVW